MNTEQLKTAEQIYEDNVGSNMELGYIRTPKENVIQAMQIFASQESKRAVDDALIDKGFIVYCLNQTWNYANEQLQKKDLGDIERDIYEKQKRKAKALMDKLDS